MTIKFRRLHCPQKETSYPLVPIPPPFLCHFQPLAATKSTLILWLCVFWTFHIIWYMWYFACGFLSLSKNFLTIHPCYTILLRLIPYQMICKTFRSVAYLFILLKMSKQKVFSFNEAQFFCSYLFLFVLLSKNPLPNTRPQTLYFMFYFNILTVLGLLCRSHRFWVNYCMWSKEPAFVFF